MPPPENVLSELIDRGSVPSNCTPFSNGYSGTSPGVDLDNGRVIRWEEPIPGPNAFGNLDGFDLRHLNPKNKNININDHLGCMGEIHQCDGIEWKIVRIVHSQPYGPNNRVELCRMHTQQLLDINIHLEVIEDAHLSWHLPGYTTLCIMRHNEPLPFEKFRKTFRYWLIVHARNHSLRVWMLRDGLLPESLSPPDDKFFDTMYCCDEGSVMLGIDDTGSEVFQLFSHVITFDTFTFLWNEYRFWSSWRSILRCCKFIARLRYSRQTRLDYAPPNGRKFIEACRTPMGF